MAREHAHRRSEKRGNAISVYFGAVGGAGAVLSQYIKSAEIVAYEALGTEAIRCLIVTDCPLIVLNDV